MLSDDEKFNILQALRKVVFDIEPKTHEEIKYGGIMFSNEKWSFGWIFPSQKHVSFEFGQGYLFDDPEKLLEWTGKYRRHLKIASIWKLENKTVSFFVKQACEI